VAAPAHPGKSAAAADHLTARLAGDDVVLFTDLRGHLILYQLVRRGWTWRGRDCEDWVRGMRVGCHDFYGPVDAAARGDRAPLRAAVAEAVDGYPGTVFVVHGTWAVGADGPLLLPGDTAVIEELGRLGYRPVAGDWEVGITEHRRP
jgi:hypothetical protein